MSVLLYPEQGVLDDPFSQSRGLGPPGRVWVAEESENGGGGLGGMGPLGCRDWSNSGRSLKRLHLDRRGRLPPHPPCERVSVYHLSSVCCGRPYHICGSTPPHTHVFLWCV